MAVFAEGLDSEALQWIHQRPEDDEPDEYSTDRSDSSSPEAYSDSARYARHDDQEYNTGVVDPDEIQEPSGIGRAWASDSNLSSQDAQPGLEPERSSSDPSVPPSAPPIIILGYEETTELRASGTGSSYNYESYGHYERYEAATESTSRPTMEENASEPPIEATKRREPPELEMRTLSLSGQAAWQAVLAYEACVRLCLRAWSLGCVEAPVFLLDECFLLRRSFGLHQLLLQPKEEASVKGLHDDADSSASKPKSSSGTIKVQVRKVKLIMRMPSGCQLSSFSGTFSSIYHMARRASNRSTWTAVRKIRILPRYPLRSNSGSYYLHAGAQYMKQVSGLLKAGVNTLRSTMPDSQELFTCTLKLKSSPDHEIVRLQPGCGSSSVFHPESATDDLLVDVFASDGVNVGHAVIQLTSLTDDPNDRVRWWPVLHDNECVGKVQLFLCYSTSLFEQGFSKWGALGETVAYDVVLDASMRAQQFGRRNLRIRDPWKWILSEFALYYGVSDVYARLRYITCIIDVATPTEDCLSLILELLTPVIKARDDGSFTRQEKTIFGDVMEQLTQLLEDVFKNYKSLDELSSSGYADNTSIPSGAAAPALKPAVELFSLLNDILSTEAQDRLRTYIQAAARKRCKRLLAETDEFVGSNNDGLLADPVSISTAYMKMKQLCSNIIAEIKTDIEIHNQHVLPSSIDLPNVTAAIYNVELSSRLRAFLVACPPSCPKSPVADLIIATDDFQRDIASWNIRTVKGGVDAKDLFHLYILLWIQERRELLLDICKPDKVRLAGVTTEHGTAPFVEDVYDRLKDTLNEYEVILNRWPEYTFVLESAVADVEREVVKAVEKYYADVLLPLREPVVPLKFSLYMQKKLRRKSLTTYSVPNQLGVVLNTIRRLLDTLRPKLESQMKSWIACLPGKAFGERLNEVTISLRTKYRSLLQAVVEKLADNASMQASTKMKRILQDARASSESQMRDRMRELVLQLQETISHLHEVFQTRVFVPICRAYWDRMAKEVLLCLECKKKESRSLYKSSSLALQVLDEVFTTQMQRLESHSLPESDLEPPRSAMVARAVLSNSVAAPQDMF